jgi:hypothetical protein
VFEGNYILQSTFRNGKFLWFNSTNGYNIFYVSDEWLPSSWVFHGGDGMDEMTVLDEGSDGHPNTVADVPDGEEWVLFYWGHNLQKRNATVLVKIFCIDTLLTSSIPTPGPSPLPFVPPTRVPSPSPSLNPSAPSPIPSYIPTQSPNPVPLLFPSPSPTLSPTLPSGCPTLLPMELPTSYPTSFYPCIFVNSSDAPILNGMYQLGDVSFNSHDRWVNSDNSADIYWFEDASYKEYWVITVGALFAAVEDSTGRWGNTHPWVWKRGIIFNLCG